MEAATRVVLVLSIGLQGRLPQREGNDGCLLAETRVHATGQVASGLPRNDNVARWVRRLQRAKRTSSCYVAVEFGSHRSLESNPRSAA